MKVLISPGNTQTAKSYPHWGRLTEYMHGDEIKTIQGILPENIIIEMVNWCDTWISIDSFLPHLAAYHKLKSGIVLWGKSDPLIFGYPHNINLLLDRKYLRNEQFKWWKDEPYDPNVFVQPEEVIKHLHKN